MHESRNEFLEHLYSEYYDSVFRLCIVIAGYDKQHYPLIEDCIQDAFIEALDKYDDYKYYKNPIGWIAKVAGNRLRSEMRKERNRRKTVSSHMRLRSEDAAFFGSFIEREMDRKALVEDILRIYSMLTDLEKIVFQEYFLAEKSLKDTAASSGLSENSVRSAVRRIRERANTIKILNLFLILTCFFH